ncbi:MAG: DNA glycosylase [Anaerovorax sp.]
MGAVKEEIRIQVNHLDLMQIFECGQCFRWEREEDGSYTGIAYGKVVNMRQEPGGQDCEQTLCIQNTTKEDVAYIWKGYLDLSRDYEKVKGELKEKDEILSKAISYGEGIRILQQEPWETVVSFLISQNNHIPRIKKCIDNLCKNFGRFVEQYHGKDYYAMPEPAVLAGLTEEDLEPVKLGYRSKYLIETAKRILQDEGRALKNSCHCDSEEAYAYLMSLCGVGPKVANCILLFSMGKMERFPIDVWVKRVMNMLYGIPTKDGVAMKGYAQEHFGEYGGIAQQYLFYYIRKLEEEKKGLL